MHGNMNVKFKYLKPATKRKYQHHFLSQHLALRELENKRNFQ